MRTKYIAAVTALIAAPVAAMANDAVPPLRVASAMTSDEIDVHNNNLSATDPNFIRCRRIEQTGSLVKKPRVCHTNEQWKRIVDRGNQDARDSMETLARGWSNAQEPRDEFSPRTNNPR